MILIICCSILFLSFHGKISEQKEASTFDESFINDIAFEITDIGCYRHILTSLAKRYLSSLYSLVPSTLSCVSFHRQDSNSLSYTNKIPVSSQTKFVINFQIFIYIQLQIHEKKLSCLMSENRKS